MKVFFVLVFLCSTILTFSQNVAFKKSNFKDNKDEFNTAVDNIEQGEEYLIKGNQKVLAMEFAGDEFNQALKYFLPAQEFNPNNAELNQYIGHSYLYTNTPYKAISYLKKSLELYEDDVDPFLYFLLGKASQLERDFQIAEDYFLSFGSKAKDKVLEPFKKLNRKHIGECKSAAEVFATKRRVWVDNVKELNSEFDEYSPCISADGSEIIISSARNGNFDVFKASKKKRKWVGLTTVDALNTSSDDIASSLAYDGQRILTHKTNDDGYSDIYESKLEGSTWSEPKLKMNKVVNSEGNQFFASYDPQDIKVYFITDAGYGGDKNISFSGKKDTEEKFWGSSQSAGQEVNSGFQEGSVYLAPDGKTMYFSSQGHTSIGGYDIFVSKRNERGQWGEPKNLGFPINSPYDELYFTIAANGRDAYYTSNREGGKGGMDIYKATFWGQPKIPFVATEDNLIASIASPIEDTYVPKSVEVNTANSLTVFKGKVLDGLLQDPIASEIKIFNNATGEEYASVRSNSVTGKFLLSLPSGLNYGISVEAEGYLFHSENFNLPEGSAYNMVNKDILLKNIDIGSKIALRNVFFDTGKSEVKIDSYAELDRLIQLMNDVPSLKIELSGHTDNVGSASNNQNLSQRRAEAVRAFLVSRKVDGSRVVAKGYGSERPVDTNDTKEGRANNRRTEFEITAN